VGRVGLAGGQIIGRGVSGPAGGGGGAAGVEDDPDDLFRHYMSLNQWTVEPPVVPSPV